MRSWTIAFLLGTYALTLLSKLPSLYWAGAGIIFFLLYLIFSTAIAWARLPTAALLGFAWILLHAHAHTQFILPHELEGKDLVLKGYIASLPEREARGQRFEFDIDSPPLKSFRVRLSWDGPYPAALKVGDCWQLQMRLKRPHGTLNLGSFDYERWLFEHHIRAVGYVRASANNQLLDSQLYHYPLDRIRQKIAEGITTNLRGQPLTGFITALAVGVRDEVTADQWQVLRGTVTNHLMAIAGLHIGLVAGMVFGLVGFLWRRSCFLMLRLPASQAAAIGALVAAVIYSALAGFSLPTQRAVIMLAVFLVSVLLRKNLPPWNALCIALLLILVWDPLAVLSDSFWLSFGAVASIIYGMSGRLSMQTWWQKAWHKWGRTQWVVALGLIPLSLLFFQQVSLGGFCANMIAIPWVGFLVLPLSLVGGFLLLFLPSLGNFLIQWANTVLTGLWPILQKMAAIDSLQWHASIPSTWMLVAAVMGVLILLAPSALPARWLGAVWFLPLLAWAPAAPQAGELWFTLLDVGQGLAIVVRTQHHSLVYDTGARFSDAFDMGDAVVAPFLRAINIRQVDRLVVSHGDNDHMGGAYSLLNQISVKEIVASEPQRFAPRAASACWQGQQWEWDSVSFQFLYPVRGQDESNNDSSCVLRVSNGKQTLLLTGDIERKSERYLVQNRADALPATILVAPHHGSRTSSTASFVSAVHPHYVLFAVGYRNRYHFPHPLVLARYQEIGAKGLRSDTSGAITFKLSADKVRVSDYRQTHGRFWNS